MSTPAPELREPLLSSPALFSPGFNMRWSHYEASPGSPTWSPGSDTADEVDADTVAEQLGSDEPIASDGQTDRDAPTPPSFGRLLRFARPEAGCVSAGLLVLLLRLPFSLAMPHFVSAALASVLAGDAAATAVAVRWFFAMAVCNAALDYGNCWLFVVARQRLVRRLRQLLFTRILGRELAFFDTVQTGSLLSRLNSDCATLGSDLTWMFRWSLENVVRTIGISAYLFIASPRLGALAWTLMPATAAANRAYGKRLAAAAQAQQDALAGASTVAAEALGAVRTVAAAHGQAYEAQRYGAWNDAAMRAGLREGWLQSVYYAVLASLAQEACIQGVLLLYGARLVFAGQLDGARLIAVMLYQGQLMQQFSGVLDSLSSVYRTTGAAAQVFKLLDDGEAVAVVCIGSGSDGMTAAGDCQQCLQPPPALGHVLFSDVHFAYPSRPAAPILRGVTLEAPPGKQLALVGPSGSGKSTLFLLLEGFYAPSSGSVTLDGLNVRTAPPQWLHAALGLVAQEPVLFSGSIAENILYCSRAQAASQRGETADRAGETHPPGAAVLTPGELSSAEAAAKLAHAHGFVSALPQRYDTPIGERGVQLSGGQRQRLGASECGPCATAPTDSFLCRCSHCSCRPPGPEGTPPGRGHQLAGHRQRAGGAGRAGCSLRRPHRSRHSPQAGHRDRSRRDCGPPPGPGGGEGHPRGAAVPAVAHRGGGDHVPHAGAPRGVATGRIRKLPGLPSRHPSPPPPTHFCTLNMTDTKPAAEEAPRVEEEAKVCRCACLAQPCTSCNASSALTSPSLFRNACAQPAAAAAATDAQAGAQAAEGDSLTMSQKAQKAKEIVTQQVEEAKSAMDKVKSLFGK